MDKADIEEYVEHAERVLQDSPQMDEENTKVKLVQPLIEKLGWDPYSPEVDLEYDIQMGVSSKKVDYAMVLDDTPVLFIEVKGADRSISESDVKQLQSYMRQVGVNWGLLTNGKQFQILKRKTDSDRPDERSLGEFSLDDLDEHVDHLKTLSRDAIESGEATNIAEKIEAVQEAVDQLREDKNEIAAEINELLSDRIEGAVPQKVEDHAKEFVDELVRSLEGQTPIEPKQETVTDQKESPKHGSWKPRKDGNAIAGTIKRQEIQGDPDATVAVFASHASGTEFIKENNAWGFVRLGRDPEYVCIYITDERQVKYFAEVETIVPANEADLARPATSYVDTARFDRNKKVVFFKPESLRELEHPIPYKDKAPQGRRYTELQSFKEAETTRDIL